MVSFDVVIIGGGFAGATLGAALTKRGYIVALCDPHEVHPNDFRAEKFSVDQIAALRRLGLAEAVLEVATPIAWNRVVRRGRIVAQRATHEFGFDYAALVRALRAQAPNIRIAQRVETIEADGDYPAVRLNGGRLLRARLVVLATGLALSLRRTLDLDRVTHSENHSLAIGFDVKIDLPAAGPLTVFGERIESRIGYLTLFPIGDRLRANLFVYRQPGEAWSREFRADPRAVLLRDMPSLSRLLPAFSIAGPPVLRPITLFAPPLRVRAGVALIGDAYSTACPAAGGGLTKALTDVERLLVHASRWLDSPGGVSEGDIQAFNQDPVRRRSQARVLSAATVARATAVDPGVYWRLRRWRNYYGMRALSAIRRLFPTAESTPPIMTNGRQDKTKAWPRRGFPFNHAA